MRRSEEARVVAARHGATRVCRLSKSELNPSFQERLTVGQLLLLGSSISIPFLP